MILDLLREELERGGLQVKDDPVTHQQFESFIVDDGVLLKVSVYSPRINPHLVRVKTSRTIPFEFDLSDPASIEKIALKILELQRDRAQW